MDSEDPSAYRKRISTLLGSLCHMQDLAGVSDAQVAHEEAIKGLLQVMWTLARSDQERQIVDSITEAFHQVKKP